MIRQIWATTTMATVATRRRSFTLTELLVTIAIISILMTIAWGAIGRVREQGRVAKTKSTIAKINQIVMAQYDGYRTRRVPIDTRGLPPTVAAKFRLWAIRCIMAWEMPDQWDEISPQGAVPVITMQVDEYSRTIKAPALWYKYVSVLDQLEAIRVANAISKLRDQGEQGKADMYGKLLNGVLLYLNVCIAKPETRELFTSNEVAYYSFPALEDNHEITERRLPVFVDGWGNPILFIRVPVGFPDSDLQVPDPQTHHDPFDPMRVDPNAFATYPLVFSAGPNGAYGLSFGVGPESQDKKRDNRYIKYATPIAWRAQFDPPQLNRQPHEQEYDWFTLGNSPDTNCAGHPYNKPPSDVQEISHFPNAHLDNIHNHRAETMP